MKTDFLPKKYREYLSLGAEIAVAIALPMLLGFAADNYFESSPIGLLIGIVVGMVLFILMMMRIAKNLSEKK